MGKYIYLSIVQVFYFIFYFIFIFFNFFFYKKFKRMTDMFSSLSLKVLIWSFYMSWVYFCIFYTHLSMHLMPKHKMTVTQWERLIRRCIIWAAGSVAARIRIRIWRVRESGQKSLLSRLWRDCHLKLKKMIIKETNLGICIALSQPYWVALGAERSSLLPVTQQTVNHNGRSRIATSHSAYLMILLCRQSQHYDWVHFCHHAARS
jgi:hypothetical protein